MPDLQQPSIIVIVVEDCLHAELGCTGQTDHATPVLALFAAQGLCLIQACADASLRTNLKQNPVEPLRGARRDLPDRGILLNFPTRPVLLHAAGY